MAEAALAEEEEKSQFTLEDEGPLSIVNPEDLLSSKEPDPIEGVPWYYILLGVYPQPFRYLYEYLQ